MFKNKAFLIVTVIMLTVAVFALSCAPAATQKPTTPATTPSSTTPPAPPANTPSSTTPPAPPSGTPTPTAPAAPAIKTSFEANTYTNATPAFTVMYPKSWIKKDASGETVLSIAATDDQTADAVNVSVIAESKDFANSAKAIIDNSGAFKQYNVKATLEGQKTVTLADGKTTAYEAIFSAKIVIYDVYLYSFGTNSGGKTIVVVGNTLKGDAKNKDMLQEIAKTLTLK